MTDTPALVWTEEHRPGRGPAFIATVGDRKIGFVSDRGEEYAGPSRCRWAVWGEGAPGGDVATAEDGRAAVEAEWARVNEGGAA